MVGATTTTGLVVIATSGPIVDIGCAVTGSGIGAGPTALLFNGIVFA